jgi:hypothetical protein
VVSVPRADPQKQSTTVAAHSDAVAFVILLARVELSAYVAFESHAGYEQRGGPPRSTPRFQRDGVWRGDRTEPDSSLDHELDERGLGVGEGGQRTPRASRAGCFASWGIRTAPPPVSSRCANSPPSRFCLIRESVWGNDHGRLGARSRTPVPAASGGEARRSEGSSTRSAGPRAQRRADVGVARKRNNLQRLSSVGARVTSRERGSGCAGESCAVRSSADRRLRTGGEALCHRVRNRHGVRVPWAREVTASLQHRSNIVERREPWTIEDEFVHDCR